MRKNGNRSLMIIATLLSLGACSPGPEERQAQIQAAAESTSYDLRIVFRGLIGFVEESDKDSDKIWALLVNASYNPAKVTEDDLPPGVYEELGGNMNPRPPDWLDRLKDDVPPHRAVIRFFNAKVTGCSECDPIRNWEHPISGVDLHLEAAAPGKGTMNLGSLASAYSIIKAREKNERLQIKDLAGLDQLDNSLLNPLSMGSPSLDRRLAARVEVEIGKDDVVSANPVPDETGYQASYTFNRPSERNSGCRGKIFLDLAEEVVVTRTGITWPLILRLGPENEITIEPDDSDKPVEIRILNQTQDMLDGRKMSHPPAYRWFYRFLDDTGQSMIDTHFYHCRKGNLGPPDCPQKRFFTVGSKERSS